MKKELDLVEIILFLRDIGYAVSTDCKKCFGKGYINCTELYCSGNSHRNEYDAHVCKPEHCPACLERQRLLFLTHQVITGEEKVNILERNFLLRNKKSKNEISLNASRICCSKTSSPSEEGKKLGDYLIDSFGNSISENSVIEINIINLPPALLISSFFFNFFESVDCLLTIEEIKSIKWISKFDFQQNTISIAFSHWFDFKGSQQVVRVSDVSYDRKMQNM